MMHVESHICSSDHGVGRQWTMRTNVREARTEVKPRWEGTISSWQRAAGPQHVKAVLNRLESGAVFSATAEDGVEGGLVVALEAIKITDRTRLNEMRAVKHPASKVSSVNAGGIE